MPPQQLSAALAWLAAHPSVGAIHSARLPANHPQTPHLLSHMGGLHGLDLYLLPKVGCVWMGGDLYPWMHLGCNEQSVQLLV